MILKRENTELGEMVYVKSSNINKICYDSTNSDMYVHFHNGSCYCYKKVNESTFRQIISSESVGKTFINEVKKNKNIDYEKIL